MPPYNSSRLARFGLRIVLSFLSPSSDLIRHGCGQRPQVSPLQGKLTRRSIPMAKFLFVYRSAGDNMAKMSPEEMQQQNQKWFNWIGEGMKKGWMLDPGDGLTAEGRVVTAKAITDGPFVESKEVVGGFSIVQADTIDAAAQLAKGCPGLLVGGRVEVRRLAGYMDKKS
jgi:hypothetical protein